MKSARVRDWAESDFELLAAAACGLSAATLSARFHGGLPMLPPGYLPTVRRRWHQSWEAVVAVQDDRLVGWAEYGLDASRPGRADVAVCVVDAQQGHGIGTALLGAIVVRAATRGLHEVHVDIAHDNAAAWRAWRSVTGSPFATVSFVPSVAA